MSSADTLVSSLNQLLAKLGLSAIVLESPFDLTPSLLVAVLECILESRLDIPPATRASRDIPSRVQAMKVFLGVLEGDVIQMDVGLSDVDPRRLAAGEWDEVVFIGQLLCWLGKTTGLLPVLPEDTPVEDGPGRFVKTASAERDMRGGAVSPSLPSDTASNTGHSYLSLSRTVPAGSDTTVSSSLSVPPAPLPHADLFDPGSQTISSGQTQARRRAPRCIHEVEELSFMSQDSQSTEDTYCACAPQPLEPLLSSIRPTSTPVRHTGWVHRVDNASELRSFEAHRPHSADRPSPAYGNLISTPRTPLTRATPPGRIFTRHNSPTEYTLALLNERAKLLAELAELKTARSKT